MTILGIDPGTASTGFGVIEYKEDEPNYIDTGVIKTTPEKAIGKRLEKIHKELKKIISDYQPDEMACEDLYFSKNKKTAQKVFQAQGIILLSAAVKNLPITTYNPQEIKKALTGYGRSDKLQTQKMVKVTLNLSSIPEPDHAADALACAICHGRIAGN